MLEKLRHKISRGELVPQLRLRLQEELPGRQAHLLMAPTFRGQPSVDFILEKEPKEAGVLVLLYQRDEKVHFVTMRRTKYPGVHSGQISFPGGRKEEHDKDLIQTAYRETEEEIGVLSSRMDHLGTLSQIYIPPSNYLVNPSVAWMNEVPIFVPEVKEVEEIIEIDLEHFIDDAILDKTDVNVRGLSREVPCFKIDENIIWGATAIILSEFRWLLNEILE